jgi:hypothetical protein
MLPRRAPTVTSRVVIRKRERYSLLLASRQRREANYVKLPNDSYNTWYP